MKTRTIMILSATAIGVAAWWGWRWFATIEPASPQIPHVPLDGAERNMVQAIEAAQNEVRKQPRSGATWGKLGMVLIANGYDQQGTICLGHAEQFEPSNPFWPYLRGVQLAAVNPRLAIPLMQRALELADKPDQRAAIQFRLALALIEEFRLDDAERQLQALEAIRPDSPNGHFGFGLLAVARGEQAAAVKHLSAIKDSPFARKRAFSLLASLPATDKEFARFCREKSQRLPQDDSWPDPLLDVVKRLKVDRMMRIETYIELERQGQFAEALNSLRKVVAESPDGEVCAILGFALLKANLLEDAANTLRQAIHYNPKHTQNHFYLGLVLLQMGEKLQRVPDGRERALELFRQAVAAEDQALAIQSTHGFAYQTRGLALKHLGRTEESLRDLRQALLILPEAADAHLALGEALAETGKLPEALRRFNDAARLASPTDTRPADALRKWRPKTKD